MHNWPRSARPAPSCTKYGRSSNSRHRPAAADRTFDGELDLKVGDKEVSWSTSGRRTRESDMLAYVPQDRTVFTGDILFVGGHPACGPGR